MNLKIISKFDFRKINLPLYLFMAFRVGGCLYPAGYRSIAYPLYSSPHGGIWKTLPSFYQDYEKQKQESDEKYRRAKEEKDKERWAEFAKKFAKGFFGFNDTEKPKEQLEPDYPYCVFGLKKSSSDEDMKSAYRKSVLKAHPDRGGSNELFRKVRGAWEYFTEYCKS